MTAHQERVSARKAFRQVFVPPGPVSVIAAVSVLFWEIVVRTLEVPSSAFPSPSRVLFELWRGGPQLGKNAWITLTESAEGLLAALAAGLLLAGLTSRTAKPRGVVGPAFPAFPKAALITLAVMTAVWFGFDFSAAASVSFMVCFLPLAANLQAGFESVPAELIEIVHSMGAGPWKTLLKVRIPAGLPAVSNALKVSIPLALAGATVEEFVGSDSGLGYFMRYAGSRTEATQLFAALTVLIMMALGSYLILRFVERVWISWPADALSSTDISRQLNPEEAHSRRTVKD